MNFDEQSEVINCLYGMDFKPLDMYAKKRKAAIAYLGDKYILAKPMERKDVSN